LLAVVLLFEDVKLEQLYFTQNYPRKRFYIPSDKLINSYSKWVFSDFGNSKVPYNFHQLGAAGIIQELKFFERLQIYRSRVSGTKRLKILLNYSDDWAPSSINTSLQTMFVLYGFLSLSCCLSLLTEQMIKVDLRLLLRRLVYFGKAKLTSLWYELCRIFLSCNLICSKLFVIPEFIKYLIFRLSYKKLRIKFQ